jgi:hypothetical protein
MTLKKRYKTKKNDQAKAKPGAKTGVKPREQQNFIDRDDSGN